MTDSGRVRCGIFDKHQSADGTAFAYCQSMETGRYMLMGRNGRVQTFVSNEGEPVSPLRVRKSHVFIEPISGLACVAGRRYVSCFAPYSDGKRSLSDNDASWTMDHWFSLRNRPFRAPRYLDDSPLVAPVPPDYVPPVTDYPYPSTIPDYSDPGGTYGEISPVTGLPRTYYVRPYFRRDGTFVRGYYRSCSRCL